MPEKKKPTLYIIDGAGYYYRAYFAIRQRLTTSKGLPTNAVYGFALMLRKILKEKAPDCAVVAFDSKEKTFRHEMYTEYKAHRPEMPEDLSAQIPYIDRLIEACNLPVLRVPGYEADDLIGSLSAKGAKSGFDVVIVTSDKDLMQLVGGGRRIYDSLKDREIGPKEVEERFGVPPDKVADVLGLMGDTSDNIPGVPGVGEKTATALVREYGGLEEVLAAAEKITRKKLSENLVKYADQARLSKELATITDEAPADFAPDGWKVRSPDTEKLRALYTELEFTSLLKELEPAASKIPRDYRAVLDEAAFAEMIGELSSSGGFTVDTETTSTDPMKARLVGMSFCAMEGRGYYLPLRHDYEGAPRQLEPGKVLPEIKKLLENEKIEKYGHNIKYDIVVLASEGVGVEPVSFDTMIASYLLNPAGRHALSTVAMERLGEKMTEYSDICGSGAKQITFDKAPVDKAADYSAEDADMTFRLTGAMRPLIGKEGLEKLLEEVEIPLIKVLARMEMTGVLVDSAALSALSVEIGDDMKWLEEKIFEEAGEEFNVNSPKQLGEVLFEKLKLPGAKRTKTGYSTGQAVLEELSGRSELVGHVLEYRQLAKLKGTYADALPKMINEKTGRIHTSFNQTVAATGRLSSSDPNLQNIPVRTEMGRKIRKAFIAPEGHKIVSADYSQIELRLLASFSGEESLLSAFARGEDIHARTAAEIFGVAPEFVTPDMRRVAKTVNFGVIYGQTAFGLARELKISRADAGRYIDSYFKRHPKIKSHINGVIKKAKKDGYVTTILGRKRWLPDINAADRQARQFAERNAVNTPMQGSAADIIKLAMISIHGRLEEGGFESKMILQVHDELVFEAPEGEVRRLSAMVREEMEGAYELAAPLVVDIGVGENWDEAH